MSKNILFPVIFLALCAGCGPEAEVETNTARARLAADQEAAPNPAADSTGPEQKEVASLDYLMGKFDPTGRPDFVAVGKPYTGKPGMMLRRETFEAFQKMWAAAKKEGITLTIVSSTRTFDQQKNIWQGKWSRFAAEKPGGEDRARKILEYSAMPGASRHHWGTDIDLNDLNNAAFEAGGREEKVYEWLRRHAPEYGFCQPYTPKNEQRPNGYNEEKWHWSYLPLAAPLLRQYGQSVRDNRFTGFAGAETAKALRIVEHYALGINPGCR